MTQEDTFSLTSPPPQSYPPYNQQSLYPPLPEDYAPPSYSYTDPATATTRTFKISLPTLSPAHKVAAVGSFLTLAVLGIAAISITLLAKKISQLRHQSAQLKLQAEQLLINQPDILYMDQVKALRESYVSWAYLRSGQGLSSSWEAFLLEGRTPLYELRSTWTAVTVPSYSFYNGWDVGVAFVPDTRYVCVWSGLDVSRAVQGIAARHGRSITEIMNAGADATAYNTLFSILGPSHTLYYRLLRDASSASTRATMAGVFGIGGTLTALLPVAAITAGCTACRFQREKESAPYRKAFD